MKTPLYTGHFTSSLVPSPSHSFYRFRESLGTRLVTKGIHNRGVPLYMYKAWNPLQQQVCISFFLDSRRAVNSISLCEYMAIINKELEL